MTRIDKYLEKYLDGSISAEETEEFRALLASDPRLEQELTETLELRSILHDDLLEIDLPSELSSHVAAMVGERFAALARTEAAEEEEEAKRRGLLLPRFFSGRRVGSMAVAAVALLVIALAPTITFENGTPGAGTPDTGIAPIGDDEFATLDLRLQEATPTSPTTTSPRTSTRLNTTRPARSSDLAATPASRQTPVPDIHPVHPVDPPTRTDPTPVTPVTTPVTTPAVDPAEALIAENSLRTLRQMINTPNLLEQVIAENLALENRSHTTEIDRPPVSRSLADLAGSDTPATDGISLALGGDSEEGTLASTLAQRRPLERSKQESYQRVMFGGTLVSGVSSGSTNLSLEGSAYLALGLGENSRVGLEGGSATFRHRRDVPVEIRTPVTTVAARAVVTDGEEGEEGEGDGVMLVGAGGGGPRTVGSEGGATNPGGERLGGADDLDQQTPPRSEPGPIPGAANPGYNVSYGLESYETETSMVYGLVFYDHTVTSISRRLSLNGRLGVGGADGGMVLSARAYAAIASHENVAWTLGLGGAMLHEFSGEIDFNATYGLNAGVQFGF